MGRALRLTAVLVLASAVVLAAATAPQQGEKAQAPDQAHAAQHGGSRHGHRYNGDAKPGAYKHYSDKNDDYRRYDDDEDDYKPYRGDPDRYGYDRSSYSGGKAIGLKFVERFNPNLPTTCPYNTLPDGQTCTFAEVDIICHRDDDYPKRSYEELKRWRPEEVDSNKLMLEEAPKTLAIGTMKTASAINNASNWRVVKIGHQMGYEVGKIAGEITFGANAGACSPRLTGATATFNVPIYAMITRASIPVTPGVLGGLNQLARAKALPVPPGPREMPGNKAKVASVDVGAEVKGLIDGSSEGSSLFAENAERYRTAWTSFCAATYVARGAVTMTKGDTSYTGVIESVLLWEHGPADSLPKFLLNSMPLNGRPNPGLAGPIGFGDLDLAAVHSVVKEKVFTWGMCTGNDKDSVPLVNPGSIKLDFEA